MFNLVFNFIVCACVLLFVAVEQAKIKSKAVKKDLLLISIAVAVVWLVDSGLLIRAILAQQTAGTDSGKGKKKINIEIAATSERLKGKINRIILLFPIDNKISLFYNN